MDTVLIAVGSLVMLAAPAYLVLQVWAAVRLAGGWRSAALAPLAVVVPILFWCSYAFADQSNLWPVPFLLFAPFGAIYLTILLLASRRAERERP